MKKLLGPLALVALIAATACTKSEGTAAAPAKAEAEGESGPSVPVVRDDSSTLLFSFLNPRGELQTASKVADVPAEVRERVLVVDLSKSPEERQAHRYAFFVDLTQSGPDGSYAVTTVSRYDAAKGEGAPSVLPPAPAGAVVIYSAEWCGFCKKAKRWMAEKNVEFIERDVEKTPGAQAELSEKLRNAGVQGGGVPVIDWSGEIVVGFDKARLERLLAAGKGAPAP